MRCSDIAGIVLPCVLPFVAAAQPSFVGLGTVPTSAGPGLPLIARLSPDGTTAAGTLQLQNGAEPAFLWTRAGGVQPIGTFPGAGTTYGVAIGPGGTVVGYTGGSGPNRAWRWNASTGFQELPPVPGADGAIALAVSSDGSWVAGGSYTQSLGYRVARWSPEGAVQDVGVVPGHSQSYVWDMSRDASTIVGWSVETTTQPFRWTESTGFEVLPLVAGRVGGSALGTNGDGTAVVGSCYGISDRGYLWTTSAGTLELPPLPGDTDSAAWHVSDDAGIVFGRSSQDWGEDARVFLWTRPGGMVDFREYLSQLGLDMSGWILTSTTGLSADGRTVAGWGLHNGQTESWIATIPSPGSVALFTAACIGLARRRRQ